jgi:hypothetical protein
MNQHPYSPHSILARRCLSPRIEALEARHMLSFAALSSAPILPFEIVTSIDPTGLWSDELPGLWLPDFERLPPSTDDHSWMPLPSRPAPPVEIPGDVPDVGKPDDSGDDPGGTIEFGDSEITENGPTPPPGGALDRESREVIAMLAKLQYPLAATQDTSRSATNGGEFGRLPPALKDKVYSEQHADESRLNDLHHDGGAVQLSRGNKGFASASRDPKARLQLHDIAIEMDYSSARYQAFEVLAAEESPASPQRVAVPRQDPTSPSQPLNRLEDAFSDESNPSSIRQHHQPLPGASSKSAESNPATLGDTPHSAPDRTEHSNSNWLLSLSIITAGVATKLIHQRRMNRKKAPELGPLELE